MCVRKKKTEKMLTCLPFQFHPGELFLCDASGLHYDQTFVDILVLNMESADSGEL